MPWKNGGGVTRELLAWPGGGDWQVRISVAEIEADGPFSSFPGSIAGSRCWRAAASP
jgi:environmental stress-induced protein Ves